jgi:hypothetical protein
MMQILLMLCFFFGCPAMVVSNYDLVKASNHDVSSLLCESHACCVLLFEELDLEGDEIVVGTGNVDSLEKWKGDALRAVNLSDLVPVQREKYHYLYPPSSIST